jgi:predicted regulator of Ras-like GTPase activity (Roadblock/LC7/MglB family)
MPDQLASVPSMLARAFADRQPLLRYFSPSAMRFEYHSDSLKFVQERVDGYAPGASYFLDVPSEKDTGEFIVTWDEKHFLLLRDFPVGDERWTLLGIGSEAAPARTAMRSAAGQMAARIKGLRERGLVPEHGSAGAPLRDRMAMALTAFRDTTEGIRMSAVTSKDGFVVASLGEDSMDPELVAPLMGHSFMAIQESTQRLCGATETVMLRMEEGILLGRELSDGLLFAALLEPSACTGQVLSIFELAGTALKQALEAMSTGVGVGAGVEVSV